MNETTINVLGKNDPEKYLGSCLEDNVLSDEFMSISSNCENENPLRSGVSKIYDKLIDDQAILLIDKSGLILDYTEPMKQFYNLHKHSVGLHLTEISSKIELNSDLLLNQVLKPLPVSSNILTKDNQELVLNISLLDSNIFALQILALTSHNTLMFDEVADGWWSWSSNSKGRFISTKLKQRLGYSSDDIFNSMQSWKKLVHPDDQKLLFRIFDKYAKNPDQDAFCVTIRFLHKNGSIRWMLCKGKLSNGLNIHSNSPNKVIGIVTDITELKENELALQNKANIDCLTGLANRTVFEADLPRAVARAERHENKLSVFFIDVNNFKQINDCFGHAFGDGLLIEVANRLSSLARSTDLVARLGGDEFAILAEDIKSPADIICIAKRYMKAFSEPLNIHNQRVKVSISIGIANYPCHGSCPESLLSSADQAMYRAKAAGENQYVFYDEEINKVVKRKKCLEQALYTALENNELYLVYQRQIDVATGEVTGFETLLRWNSPQLGMVRPDEFIPVAEQAGLIDKIGKWVIKSALIEFKRFSGQFSHKNIKLALNISKYQLNASFTNFIKHSVLGASIELNKIVLEFDEDILAQQNQRLIMSLNALSELGVSIAIDNFGSSCASLSYLQVYPISKLKIDKRYLHDVNKNLHNLGFVRALIALSESINVKVIAEGVETKEQLAFVKKERCVQAQGYYFGKPLSCEELINFDQSS